jgi:hypothetical protein
VANVKPDAADTHEVRVSLEIDNNEERLLECIDNVPILLEQLSEKDKFVFEPTNP